MYTMKKYTYIILLLYILWFKYALQVHCSCQYYPEESVFTMIFFFLYISNTDIIRNLGNFHIIYRFVILSKLHHSIMYFRNENAVFYNLSLLYLLLYYIYIKQLYNYPWYMHLRYMLFKSFSVLLLDFFIFITQHSIFIKM